MSDCHQCWSMHLVPSFGCMLLLLLLLLKLKLLYSCSCCLCSLSPAVVAEVTVTSSSTRTQKLSHPRIHTHTRRRPFVVACMLTNLLKKSIYQLTPIVNGFDWVVSCHLAERRRRRRGIVAVWVVGGRQPASSSHPVSSGPVLVVCLGDDGPLPPHLHPLHLSAAAAAVDAQCE